MKANAPPWNLRFQLTSDGAQIERRLSNPERLQRRDPAGQIGQGPGRRQGWEVSTIRESRIGAMNRGPPARRRRSRARFLESSLSFLRRHCDHEPAIATFCCTCNKRLQVPQPRFMGSPLFPSDLLTGHEPDRVCAVLRRRKQCGRCDPLVPCARREDWFRWWTSAHFGEARVGFPVGKVCLFQNSTGLRASGQTIR